MPITGTSITPGRAVAVLTPLVFAPLAGAIAAGVAKYGVDIDGSQLQAIFIAGATVALAKSAQWSKGWQAFEQRQEAHASDALTLAEPDDDMIAEIGEDDDVDDDAPEAMADDDMEPAGAEAGGDDLEADDLDEMSLDAGDDDIDDALAGEFDDDDMDDVDAEDAELLAAQGS